MSVRAGLSTSSLVLIALAVFAPTAMGQSNSQAATNGSAGGVSADARAQAKDIYDSRCSACHGAEGHGDGPGAAALHPKPINFHNTNWQKAVTDAQIAKAIVYGGSAVGLSNQMAANPDLEDEPGVVRALVAHVRELGR
jgi:mono/diheme cytochrome c family protein